MLRADPTHFIYNKPIPGFGQVNRPRAIQDGCLYEHLLMLFAGETVKHNTENHTIYTRAWRYRKEHDLFALADIWARHAGQLARSDRERTGNPIFKDQLEYAKQASLSYYADFVSGYERYRRPQMGRDDRYRHRRLPRS